MLHEVISGEDGKKKRLDDRRASIRASVQRFRGERQFPQSRSKTSQSNHGCMTNAWRALQLKDYLPCKINRYLKHNQTLISSIVPWKHLFPTLHVITCAMRSWTKTEQLLLMYTSLYDYTTHRINICDMMLHLEFPLFLVNSHNLCKKFLFHRFHLHTNLVKLKYIFYSQQDLYTLL